MVETGGVTTVLPDERPPVLKFTPVQDTPVEDQVRVDDSPGEMVNGLALMVVPEVQEFTVQAVLHVFGQNPLLEPLSQDSEPSITPSPQTGRAKHLLPSQPVPEAQLEVTLSWSSKTPLL